MVHRCGLVTNTGKEKDGSRVSTEKGAKLLSKKLIPDNESVTDEKPQQSRSTVHPSNKNCKQKSSTFSSLPFPEHSITHKQGAVRLARSKHSNNKNNDFVSSSTARSGLRSSSLESCTSLCNTTSNATDSTGNIGNSDKTQKKKMGKKAGAKSKAVTTGIADLKKANSVESLLVNESTQLSSKLSKKISNAQKQQISTLPLTFICSLPLDRLSGIIGHLKGLGSKTHENDQDKEGTSGVDPELEEEEKNINNSMKSLCLYCDKKFLTQKMRFKHTERFHTVAKDRRSSSRNPNAVSSALVSPTSLSSSLSSSSSSSTSSSSSSQNVTESPVSASSFPGCSYCSKSPKLQVIAAASDLDSLFYHFVDQHSEKYFGCKLCAIRFQNIEKLDQHMQSIHQDYKLSSRNLSEKSMFTVEKPPDSNKVAVSLEPAGNDVARSLSSGKFESETNGTQTKTTTTRRQKNQSHQRKSMTPTKMPCSSTTSSSSSSSLLTRSLSQMPSNVCFSSNSSNINNISNVSSSSGGIFVNDEAILSRLGVTQNRLPHGRKGVRNRRQASVTDIALKSEIAVNAVSVGVGGAPANAITTKTRNKIGRIITTVETTSDNVTFRAPTFINRAETLSCTFDDDFYEKVNLNVRSNLSCHLDGKIESGPASPSPSINPTPPIAAIRSTVVKSPLIIDSEIHAATSLAAITAFPTLLTADQYGCDVGTAKIKRPITKHSWKWKWDSVKKYKYVNEGGKFVKKVKQPMLGLRDLSKLDMWTQLTMRQKHELAQKHLTNEIAEIGEHSREEKQKQIDQLNTILDNRLLPQITLEQNEQTIIKVEIDEDKTIYSLFSSAATTNTTTTQTLEISSFSHTNSFYSLGSLSNDCHQSTAERCFPFNLNLIPLAASNRAVKRTVVLSGEWARPRCYLCFGCGAKFDKLKALDEHKMFRHPHVYSTHYEIVGRELIEGNLYKHFFIPSKAFNHHHEEVACKTRRIIISGSTTGVRSWPSDSQRILIYKKTDDNLSKRQLQLQKDNSAGAYGATTVAEEESLDSLHSISPSCIETLSSSKSSDDCDTDTKTVIGINSTASSISSDVVQAAASIKTDCTGNDIHTMAVSSFSINCTKCSRKCNGMLELYRHMLDCSGDYAWILAKKRKYRYYGSKKRRQFNKQNITALRMYRQNKLKEEELNKSAIEGCTDTPKKKPPSVSPSTPRPRPSDAESIKKMLENLPAKRICREIIPNATKPKSRKLNQLAQQMKNLAANSSNRKLQLKNLQMKSKTSANTTKALTAISKNILRSHKLRNIKKKGNDIKSQKKKTKKCFSAETTSTTPLLDETIASSMPSNTPEHETDEISSNTNDTIKRTRAAVLSVVNKTDKGIVRKIGAKTKCFVKQIKKRFQSNKNVVSQTKKEDDGTTKSGKQSIVRKLSFEKCSSKLPERINTASDKSGVSNSGDSSICDISTATKTTVNVESAVETTKLNKDGNKKSEIKNEKKSNADRKTILNDEENIVFQFHTPTKQTETNLPDDVNIIKDFSASEMLDVVVKDASTSAISSVNQVSPTTKRRSKKINDCIAMLTGKLQEKMGKDFFDGKEKEAQLETPDINSKGRESPENQPLTRCIEVPPIDKKVPKRKAQSRRIVKIDNFVEKNNSGVHENAEEDIAIKTTEKNLTEKQIMTPSKTATPAEQKVPKRKVQSRPIVNIDSTTAAATKEKVHTKPQLKCKPVESLMQPPVKEALFPELGLSSKLTSTSSVSQPSSVSESEISIIPSPVLASQLAQLSPNVTVQLIKNSSEKALPIVSSSVPALEINPIKLSTQQPPIVVVDQRKTNPITSPTKAKSSHLNIPLVSCSRSQLPQNTFNQLLTPPPSSAISKIPEIHQPTMLQVPIKGNNTSSSSFIDLSVPLATPLQLPVSLQVPPAAVPQSKLSNTRACIPKRRQTISVAPNEFIFGLNQMRMNSYNDFPFEIEVPLDLSKKSKKVLSPQRPTSFVLPPVPLPNSRSSSSVRPPLPIVQQNKESAALTITSNSGSYPQASPQVQSNLIVPNHSVVPFSLPGQIFPFHPSVELLKIPQVRNPVALAPVQTTSVTITTTTMPPVQKPKRSTSKRNKKQAQQTDQSGKIGLQQPNQELINPLAAHKNNVFNTSLTKAAPIEKTFEITTPPSSAAVAALKNFRLPLKDCKTSEDFTKTKTNLAPLQQDQPQRVRRPTAAELKQQIDIHINDAITSVINAANLDDNDGEKQYSQSCPNPKRSTCKDIAAIITASIAIPNSALQIPTSTNEINTGEVHISNEVNSTVETNENTTSTHYMTSVLPSASPWPTSAKINEPCSSPCPKTEAEISPASNTKFSDFVKQKNPPNKVAADTTTPQDNIIPKNSLEFAIKEFTIIKPKRRSARRKTVDCKMDLTSGEMTKEVTASARKEVEEIAASVLSDVEHEESSYVTENSNPSKCLEKTVNTMTVVIEPLVEQNNKEKFKSANSPKKIAAEVTGPTAASSEVASSIPGEIIRKTRSKLPSPDTTAYTNTTSSAPSLPLPPNLTIEETAHEMDKGSTSQQPSQTVSSSPPEMNEIDRKNCTTPSSTQGSTQRKQRRRRKNELAAIVADQLLESFKEVDQARIDDLKKLENLAYEKSEDLLLTGMRLMPTKKRKATNSTEEVVGETNRPVVSTNKRSTDKQITTAASHTKDLTSIAKASNNKKNHCDKSPKKQSTSSDKLKKSPSSTKSSVSTTVEDGEIKELVATAADKKTINKKDNDDISISLLDGDLSTNIEYENDKKSQPFKNFGTYRSNSDSIVNTILPNISDIQTPPATPSKITPIPIGNLATTKTTSLTADVVSEQVHSAKKTKKKQLKKRDKSIESENINKLRSGLESFTLGKEEYNTSKSPHRGIPYHITNEQQEADVQVFSQKESTPDAAAIIQTPTISAVPLTPQSCPPRNSSSILRPSILAATLDNNAAKDNQIAAESTPKPRDRKSAASSRDPRINKNIHSDEYHAESLIHRESRLASLRQRRNANFPAFSNRCKQPRSSTTRRSTDEKHQETAVKSNILPEAGAVEDDDDDNYLTEIAKKVNDQIMSAEDKDFNTANDGFELANTFLVSGGGSNSGVVEPYSRPPTSMSVCSAPNLNDDRSNFDALDTDDNTNTEIIDMDLDDDMSVYTSISQDLSRGRGQGKYGGRRRRRRRRSILLTRKPKKTNLTDLNSEKYDCVLCNKTFYKSSALQKHQMTLAHVSKVSEQEYLDSTANKSNNDSTTVQRNMPNRNALTSTHQQSSDFVMFLDREIDDNNHDPISNVPSITLKNSMLFDISADVTPAVLHTTGVSTVVGSQTATTIEAALAEENELPKKSTAPLGALNNIRRTSIETDLLKQQSQVLLHNQHKQVHMLHHHLTTQPAPTAPPAYIPLSSVLNQAAIEPISSPEQNCERERCYPQPQNSSSSRLTLNPDERLFFECCNILKGSETPLVERSYPIPESTNSAYVYGFQVKPVTPKSTSERFTYLKSASESRNVGDANNKKDCNYPSIDLNQFSDISSDSNPAQAPAAVLPDSYNMHLPVQVTNIKNPSNISAPSVLPGVVHREHHTDRAEPHLGAPTIASLPQATARTFVNQPSQLMVSHCMDNNEYGGGYAIPSSSFQKQNFTSPIHSASSQGSTITTATTCRLKTKAAMKGYDNLKVSIPTVGLDMEQALERSPRAGCKLTALAEIALGNEKPMQTFSTDSPQQQMEETTNSQRLRSKVASSDSIVQREHVMPLPKAVAYQDLVHNSSLSKVTKKKENEYSKSPNIQLETDECIPIAVIENTTNSCLPSAKDIYEFDDTENTPSSKAIMHSTFVKAATEAAASVAADLEDVTVIPKKVIIIPDRPFKNIGLEEKEAIKFQKPEAPPSPINLDDNTLSTVSYSDRDDFVYGSLSGGDDDDDENDAAATDDKENGNDHLNDDSSNSSAVTLKTYENKSHIMGRIFKNATTKSKMCIENSKDSPPVIAPPPLPPPKQIPKQDLDRLFDKLRGITDNKKSSSKQQQQQQPQEKTCAIVANLSNANVEGGTSSTAKKTSAGKKTTKTKAKPQKATSSPSGTTTTAKRTSARKNSAATRNQKELTQLHSELGMSPEDIAELIGEGQRKSQRRCAVNRQKKLVEMWSSDEYEEFLSTKDIFALIEEKEQKQTKRKRKSSGTGGIASTTSSKAYDNHSTNKKKSSKKVADVASAVQKDNNTMSSKINSPKSVGAKNNDQRDTPPRVLDSKSKKTGKQYTDYKDCKKKSGKQSSLDDKDTPVETQSATNTRKIPQRRNSAYVKTVDHPKTSTTPTKKKKKSDEGHQLQSSAAPFSGDSDSDFEVESRCGRAAAIETTVFGTAVKSQKIRDRRKTITGKIEVEKQPRSVGKKAIAALKTKIALDSQPQTTTAKGKSKQKSQSKQQGKANKKPPSSGTGKDEIQLRPQARRKRIASEMLYYWSSSSDEEFGRIETPQDDEDDLDDGDHYQQHGWIVGDSHKKLVTLLAIAKGNKKVDDCGVKETNSKKKI